MVNRCCHTHGPALHSFQPGEWVRLKTWKTGSPQHELTHKRNEPHLVILSTHSVLRLQGSLCGCHTQWRGPPRPNLWKQSGAMDPLDYSCESLSGLKLLLWKNTKVWPGIFRLQQSLNIRAHFCLQAKDVDAFIFRKKIHMWPLFSC